MLFLCLVNVLKTLLSWIVFEQSLLRVLKRCLVYWLFLLYGILFFYNLKNFFILTITSLSISISQKFYTCCSISLILDCEIAYFNNYNYLNQMLICKNS